MVKPLKNLLEQRVEQVIAEKFGLDADHWEQVREYDRMLLKSEKQQLFPKDSTEWPGLNEIEDYPYHIRLRCFPRDEAEQWFLQAFHRLWA